MMAANSALEHPATAGLRWKAARLPLPAVDMSGLWAVFNPASGETHLLDEAALAVLNGLAAAPATTAALADRLCRQYAFEDDGALVADLHAALSRLDALGLVERLP